MATVDVEGFDLVLGDVLLRRTMEAGGIAVSGVAVSGVGYLPPIPAYLDAENLS